MEGMASPHDRLRRSPDSTLPAVPWHTRRGRNHRRGLPPAWLPAILGLACAHPADAFTYQGYLEQGGQPAAGTFTIAASLFAESSGSDPVTPPIVLGGITTLDGRFSVELDFPSTAFDGSPRWLEISVGAQGSPGLTTLAPRQALSPVPYAVHALNGGGTQGPKGDPGEPGPMGPPGPAGLSPFQLVGNTALLPANLGLPATSSHGEAGIFFLGNIPFLHAAGNANAFVGGAASPAVTGFNSTAVGAGALSGLTSGYNNSALGAYALNSTTNGWGNTAVGVATLFSHASGAVNTAVGHDALRGITAGDGNIAVGADAGRNLLRGNNNIAIGNPGAPEESGFIRIGTPGVHNATHLAGTVRAEHFAGNGGGLTNVPLHEAQSGKALLFGPGYESVPIRRFEPAPLINGSRPADLVVADFNRDGLPDIASLNQGNVDVSIALNRGEGRFSVPTNVRVGDLGSTVTDFLTLDANRDGIADLVISSSQPSGITTLLGDGTGRMDSVRNELPFPANTQCGSLASGDFNRDGFPDLVVGNVMRDSQQVFLVLGDPSGTALWLYPMLPIETGIAEPGEVACADLNNDGFLDVVVGGESRMGVCLGNGDGTFQAVLPLTLPGQFVGFHLGEANGDGVPDLAITMGPSPVGNPTRSIGIFHGLGNGRFQQHQHIPLDSSVATGHVHLADLNNDGRPDVIHNTFGASDGIRLLLADRHTGSLVLAPGRPLNPPGITAEMITADFNGDGTLDIACAVPSDDAIHVHLSRGMRILMRGDLDGPTAVGGDLTVEGTVHAEAFNTTSDRNAKANFASVDPHEILERVNALPISRWNFRTQPGIRHVGPMAQDFHDAFGLGTDDRHIATVDADGIALAAIQGLNRKLEATIQRLEARIAELEARPAAATPSSTSNRQTTPQP